MGDIDRDMARASDLVIASFVYEKATGTEGVYGIGRGLPVLTINQNGQESKVRGIRVVYDEENGYTIEIYLIVDFGVNIPETAWNVQKNVHDGLKSEYGIEPENINIHVQGVQID